MIDDVRGDCHFLLWSSRLMNINFSSEEGHVIFFFSLSVYVVPALLPPSLLCVSVCLSLPLSLSLSHTSPFLSLFHPLTPSPPPSLSLFLPPPRFPPSPMESGAAASCLTSDT